MRIRKIAVIPRILGEGIQIHYHAQQAWLVDLDIKRQHRVRSSRQLVPPHLATLEQRRRNTTVSRAEEGARYLEGG